MSIAYHCNLGSMPFANTRWQLDSVLEWRWRTKAAFEIAWYAARDMCAYMPIGEESQ